MAEASDLTPRLPSNTTEETAPIATLSEVDAEAKSQQGGATKGHLAPSFLRTIQVVVLVVLIPEILATINNIIGGVVSNQFSTPASMPLLIGLLCLTVLLATLLEFLHRHLETRASSVTIPILPLPEPVSGNAVTSVTALPYTTPQKTVTSPTIDVSPQISVNPRIDVSPEITVNPRVSVNPQSPVDSAGKQALPLTPVQELNTDTLNLGSPSASTFPFVFDFISGQYAKALSTLRDAITSDTTTRGLFITGAPNSGKTRLAYQVLKEALSNDWLVLQWGPESTMAEIPSELALAGQKVVLWLDDVQQYEPPRTQLRLLVGTGEEDLILLDASPDKGTAALRALHKRLVQPQRGLRPSQVVIVAMCRTGEVSRADLALDWLISLLTQIDIPPIPEQQKSTVFTTLEHHARPQDLLNEEDWDNTLGSVILGLVRRHRQYRDLVEQSDAAAGVLRAMKLLALAGTTAAQTDRCVRALAITVEGETVLDDEKKWHAALRKLERLELVTEENERLAIAKDVYFERVLDDYLRSDQDALRMRKLAEAREVFVALGDVPALLRLADTYFGQSHYQEALTAYEQALILDPQVARVWALKGLTLAGLKRYEEALTAYEQALILDPLSAYAWTGKGGLLAILQRDEEALAAYEQALILDPQVAFAWALKGVTLGSLKRYDEALTAYEQALILDPLIAFAWARKGNMLAILQRYDEALTAYEQALILDPLSADVWTGKGNMLAILQRDEEALAAYEQALILDPLSAYAWSFKGHALRELKRHEEALAAYELANLVDPQYVSAWNDKGSLLLRMERFEEALVAFERALDLDPKFISALDGKSNAYLKLQHYDKALDVTDQALLLEPNEARWWNWRGKILLAAGRAEESLAAYEQALELSSELRPPFEPLMSRVGRELALRALGRHAEPDAIEPSGEENG